MSRKADAESSEQNLQDGRGRRYPAVHERSYCEVVQDTNGPVYAQVVLHSSDVRPPGRAAEKPIRTVIFGRMSLRLSHYTASGNTIQALPDVRSSALE